ncbi:unnamed protein product [Calypogeia fissa]
MSGTARYFWRHFVQQGHLINDAISLTETKKFSVQAGVLDRVETLFLHLPERGERDLKYQEFLDQAWIANLFYEENKELDIVDAIRLIPSHIYRLSGNHTMTKELVRDVGVKGRNIPKGLEAPPIDEVAEMKGVGTSNPHPVGLPSLATVVAQVAAQDMAA